MFHSLKIINCRHETPDALCVSLAIPENLRDKFMFKPGQFVMLKLEFFEQPITRSYSITSQPADAALTILIKKIPDGCVSVRLHDTLKIGDILQISSPRGLFHSPENADTPQKPREHVYFAAGSGITPIFSMIHSILADEPEARVKLFYGNKKAADTIFFEQLNNLKDIYLSRFEMFHVFSRQKQNFDFLNGRLDEKRVTGFFENGLLRPQSEGESDAHYYICGPDTMVADVKQALQHQGIDAAHVFCEEFIAQKRPAELADMPPAKPAPATSADDDENQLPIDITIHGTQETVTLNQETDNLIDAALMQGVKLPFSCRGGMCSTCRCKLTAGKLDMKHNFSLEPWELEQGFILGCQVTLDAIAADSAKIELDFDAS